MIVTPVKGFAPDSHDIEYHGYITVEGPLGDAINSILKVKLRPMPRSRKLLLDLAKTARKSDPKLASIYTSFYSELG